MTNVVAIDSTVWGGGKVRVMTEAEPTASRKMYRMDTGKDIPGGPMEMPRGWKPRQRLERDMSKVARHQLDDGLEFYRDVTLGGVSTSRKDTYLRRHGYGSHTEYMHDFFELSLYGERLFVLPSLQVGKGFDYPRHKTSNGLSIWTIGEFRGRVEIRDVFTYPWVPYGEAAPWITWEGIGQFESLDQQKHFLSVLERFLEIEGPCHPLDILEGADVRAAVEYDPELQEKINAGELVL